MPPTNEDREKRLLQAAGRLIAHYGYDKTTISDIAQEAGISKGAVYLHYKSKEALLDGLITYESARVVDDLIVRLEADPEGGSIFGLYLHGVLAAAANPVIKALIVNDKRVLGDAVRRLRKGQDFAQSMAIMEHFVSQFQEANLIRKDMPPDAVIYFLGIVRYGLLMVDDVLPDGHQISLEQFGPVLAELLQRALEPEGGGDREAGKRAIARILQLSRQMLAQRGSDTYES
jgi:AcrR family transcriptional regulator